MTPSQIKEALAELGGRANKHLGQHFLIDASALRTIVEAADVKPEDRVLEIGPGLGVLTNALLEKQAEVFAIEQDRRFIDYLEKKFVGSSLHVTQGDAAVIHWHESIGEGSWKFVSNLPYSITSLALRKALWAPRPPERLVVLVQREVAERVVSTAPSPSSSPSGRGRKTSLLSLMVALSSSSARIVKRVPAGAFFPPPKVESAILEVIPLSWKERETKWGIHPDRIMEVAKRGFAHPRKFLASNLGVHADALIEAGIAPKARAESLSPNAWATLTKQISDLRV
jgi:16S rRNA (adenine1518-N6/adenine1519-N6)-dimethyltransferase